MINGTPAFLWFPMWVIGVVGGFMILIGGIGQLITYPILRFVLREREDDLIHKLDTYAPRKIQGHATRTYGLSWLTTNQAAFRFISKVIYRWHYKITPEEMNSWRAGIKKELGSHFFIYWLNITMNNVTTYGILTLGFFTGIESQYDIVGAFR